MFPDGIEYDRKNDEYRTFRVNQFFSYIPTIVKDLEHKKTGSFRKKSKKSGLVPEVGQITNFLKDDIKLILELEKRDIKLT